MQSLGPALSGQDKLRISSKGSEDRGAKGRTVAEPVLSKMYSKRVRGYEAIGYTIKSP